MATFTFDFDNVFDFTRIDDAEYLNDSNVVTHKKDNYTLIKYNKNALTASNVASLGNFRSVIFNHETGNIVCFAPPKSFYFELFQDKYIEDVAEEKTITYEDYVEGTMINVFFDGEWQIATRSVIGGKGVFFKGGKTFRQMFLECMNACSLEFDELNTEYCYSFVIQHPDNRIVSKVREPKLFLCAVYKIDGHTVTEIDGRSEEIVTKVHVPKQYNFSCIQDAKDSLTNVDKTPYYVQGVVMKYNGMRTKIRNPNFEYVRKLRGNQPKSQFQYLSLRRTGKVSEYLKYYPEFAREFNEYRSQIHDFTSQLHTNYINCYVKKMKPLGEFAKEFRSHMYSLHQLYINELIPKKQYVNRDYVIKYVNELPSTHLMYSLNFKYRQQKVHEASVEKQEKLCTEA